MRLDFGGSYNFGADTNLTLTFPGHRHLEICLPSFSIALTLMPSELPLQSLVWWPRISCLPPSSASLLGFTTDLGFGKEVLSIF